MSEGYELPPETDEQKARRLRRQAEADALTERKKLGAEGRLRCIEVIFQDGNETKRFMLANQTGAEVLLFREKVFAAGLMVPIDPGRWLVVPPWKITEITIQKQNKFFD